MPGMGGKCRSPDEHTFETKLTRLASIFPDICARYPVLRILSASRYVGSIEKP